MQKEAQRNLAECYYRGIGTKRDLVKAEYWARNAVKQGYSNAEALHAEIVDAVDAASGQGGKGAKKARKGKKKKGRK